MENRFSYMKPRCSLWKTLYPGAARAAHVRISRAMAHKLWRAMEDGARGWRKEKGKNGVRVGRLVLPTLPPQQPAQSQANSTGSQSPSTPSSDQQTASEGEDFSGDGEGRNTRVWSISRTYPTMARSHFQHPGWGAWSLRRNG